MGAEPNSENQPTLQIGKVLRIPTKQPLGGNCRRRTQEALRSSSIWRVKIVPIQVDLARIRTAGAAPLRATAPGWTTPLWVDKKRGRVAVPGEKTRRAGD